MLPWLSWTTPETKLRYFTTEKLIMIAWQTILFFEQHFHRLPIEINPSLFNRIVLIGWNAALSKRETRPSTYRWQSKNSFRIMSRCPIAPAPRLNDLLVRNQFKVHAFDLIVVRADLAAYFPTDLRFAAGHLRVLLRVHQRFVDVARFRFDGDYLSDRFCFHKLLFVRKRFVHVMYSSWQYVGYVLKKIYKKISSLSRKPINPLDWWRWWFRGSRSFFLPWSDFPQKRDRQEQPKEIGLTFPICVWVAISSARSILRT